MISDYNLTVNFSHKFYYIDEPRGGALQSYNGMRYLSYVDAPPDW